MTTERARAAWIVRQFGHPRGPVGRLAGWVMAHRTSNRERNRWTVDRLGLRRGERVLEVGFGPGLALGHAVHAVGPAGHVDGVDRSKVMLAQASRRHRAAIAAGTVSLQVASVEALPASLAGPYDAIYAVNSVGFWPDPVARLRDLRTRLASGGRLALTVQPRTKGATVATSVRAAAGLERQLKEAGFDAIEVHSLPLDPPAVCLVGLRADLGGRGARGPEPG